MTRSKQIPTINCSTHGKQPETFVCVHIIEALKKGEPSGFWWSRGPEGGLDAVCNDCNALSQAAFDALGADNIKNLCLGCFEDGALLNDVALD